MLILARRSVPSDTGEILRIERASFPSPWSRASIAYHVFGMAGAVSFSAECRGRLIGYIMAMRDGEDLHITNLAVDEDMRRSGAAGLLISCVSDIASSGGYRRMILEVRDGNAPARALYEKEGFTVCGISEGYYDDSGEDAILMERKV